MELGPSDGRAAGGSTGNADQTFGLSGGGAGEAKLTQIKSPRHKITKEFLLDADWEGGAPEIWEKGRTSGNREMRERQEFCPELEPGIAWSCFGGMEK